MSEPATTPKKRVTLSWSSGKDSAWSLHTLMQDPDVELTGLLTTLNQTHDRVAMHAVRRRLLRCQAEAARLPLLEVDLPWPCSNEAYEARMERAVAKLRADGVTHIAFGDLFLEDIRRYREEKLAGTGITPLFPIWGQNTAELARAMVDAGVVAHLTTVDPKQLDPCFVGRRYDHALLADLPASADPCGERGEFHTLVSAGPMFREPLPLKAGEVLERDGFWFADFELAD
jgi:uncharacterized protein (TIGR00290 family)